MAGSPRKRARRERQIARPGIPLGAPAHDAPGGTRHPAGPAAPARAEGPAAATRRIVDDAQAEQLGKLADTIGAGMTVRLERVRPSWCAGWVEDRELDTADLGELYAEVAATWGGERYRVTVIHPSGQVLHTATIRIAGPPRLHGARINRRAWDAALQGTELDQGGVPTAAAVVAPAAGALEQLGGEVSFLKLFLDEQSKSRDHIYGTVERMAQTHAKQTHELIEAFAKEATQNRERTSLTGQLAEVAESMQAVDGLRTAVADSIPKPPEDEEEPTSPLARRAGEMFLEKVFAAEEAAPTQPRPTPRRSRRRPAPPTNGTPGQPIPQAKVIHRHQPD